MKPEVRLDSAVFQLTPTRTRCDLVITSNGRTEKLASGLLKPFLAHLKTAQDQIAKGGYSIALKPDPETDAVWFTKGTVERFVRFVSTPEVLERVTTTESEILQIEEAIAVQSNDNLGFSTVEDHQTKSTECVEDNRLTADADADKAIVLYKPGSQPHPAGLNGTTKQEENSKVQLLRVLETRKTVLQKEQGMAFARAVAAGFDMDNLAHLVSFAECFGASRLMEACLKFMELWKRKHETGQWLEVEAAEVMSSRCEFPSFSSAGIVFSGESNKQNAEVLPVNSGDRSTENGGESDQNAPLDSHNQMGTQNYFQGQFHQPAYPPWPMHPPPPGTPLFPPYSVMQGIPYYQNYPGPSPYFYPPYPPTDDTRLNTPSKMSLKRQSLDGIESNIDSHDAMGQSTSEFEKESSLEGKDSHKRTSHSRKKQPGVVVIKNLNYIESKKKHGASGSDSGSATEDETEEDSADMHSSPRVKTNSKSSSSSKRKDHRKNYEESLDSYIKDEIGYVQDQDSGNWQAFQSFLLRAEEKTRANDIDIFAGEKEPTTKKKERRRDSDPFLPSDRDSGNARENLALGFDSLSGKGCRMKQSSTSDEFLASSEGRSLIDGRLKEIEGGRGGYRRAKNDEFLPYGDKRQTGSQNSLYPLDFEHPSNSEKNPKSVRDESFMLPVRSGSSDQVRPERRTALDIESEFPSDRKRIEDSYNRLRNQLNYEPDDLSLMPERGLERLSINYDPAKDYESQIIAVENSTKVEENLEDASKNVKDLKKLDKEGKKLMTSLDGLERRKKEVVVRRAASSRINPSSEAQKRAEKLRAFKADLQKLKKEKEEEEKRRLEALKRERQKRIAARTNPNTTHSPSTPQLTKPRSATKVSPSSYKSSKFTDSEPGSSSPLAKVPIRRTSIGSGGSQNAAKTSRLNTNSNMLSHSAPSLREMKKETNGITKRLSDPKLNSRSRASVSKPVSSKSQANKVSAIAQLNNKSTTLPESRIRSPKTLLGTVQNKPYTKESSQRKPGMKTSAVSENRAAKRVNEKGPRRSNSEENPVIEKTVVMLENAVVSSPYLKASETIDVKDRLYRDDSKEKAWIGSEYAAIRAPPSPVVVGGVESSINHSHDSRITSYEVVIDYAKDESQKSLSLATLGGPYQAPFARLSSIEDSAAKNSTYTEPLPAYASETATHAETITARVPNSSYISSIDQAQETHEKPRTKESKGIRKLWKFGRKSHASASSEGNPDPDAWSVDDAAVGAVSSNDAHMLKNLISQDDTNSGITPAKVSRPFSLLSPFRGKNNEQKTAS
ncbi:hypothetical protein ACMD2_07780 [Ananas comosus]|uniref:COP1-interacting protein 7 n=1 Tax=Ananas comosus TaxID=4615 RepID=A0A199V6V0_ANACO|nr:hypothetical protein ACMD2_07780 [Ananas comosus]